MNGFFANLINRHLGTCDTIQPRMRGRFETDPVSVAETSPTEEATPFTAESEQEFKPPRQAAQELTRKTADKSEPLENKKDNSSPYPLDKGDASIQGSLTEQQVVLPDVRVLPEEAYVAQTPATDVYSPRAVLEQEHAHKASLATGEHNVFDDGHVQTNINKPLAARGDNNLSPAPPAGDHYLDNELNHRIHIMHQRLADDRVKQRNRNPLSDPAEKESPLLDAAITPLVPDSASSRQAAREESSADQNRNNTRHYGRLETPSWLPDMEPKFNQRLQESEAKTEPVINVTIGRVEVRAVKPETAKNVSHPITPTGVMTLDEYLKQHEGEGAG